MNNGRQWIIWFTATLGSVAYLSYCLFSQPEASARTFLPGVTTHGHYQIELQCKECHSPGMGVLYDACTRCHGQELKDATDTHPRSKFTDPGKSHMVKKLDGRSCISCHQEHVPDRTHAMGLSLPTDYCWHCHQDVGEQRPSHENLAYDSCATAGCHNYHDNRALFENFLVNHHGEPDILATTQVPLRQLSNYWQEDHPDTSPLTSKQADSPSDIKVDQELLDQWAETSHAAAGVNCSACHTGDNGKWYDKVTHQACQDCHESEVNTFLAGRHGMRLSVGLSAMTPEQARLPMHAGSHHKELTCVACHDSHRFDTQYAAVEACLKCHNDEHSLAYKDSPHFALWQDELSEIGEPGTGVTCATCHMPREEDSSGKLFVQHNQNNNLRPNDKMVKTVCSHCHGLQYTLDSLADSELIKNNFKGESKVNVESIDMAKAWADERARLREERKNRKENKK